MHFICTFVVSHGINCFTIFGNRLPSSFCFRYIINVFTSMAISNSRKNVFCCFLNLISSWVIIFIVFYISIWNCNSGLIWRTVRRLSCFFCKLKCKCRCWCCYSLCNIQRFINLHNSIIFTICFGYC